MPRITLLASVMLLAAAVAGQDTAPATAPATATANITSASAPAEAPAPAPESAPAPAARETGKLMFQFEDVPCDYVVKRFTQAFGRQLYSGSHVDGAITFVDTEPYTYEEAYDLVNTLLQMKGFELREDGRFLKVVPLAQVAQLNKIYKGMDDAVKDEPRPSELVTVLLPLKYMDAATATNSIVRMVSTFGSISPMPRGRGLIITDRMATVKRVKEFLDHVDTSGIGAERAWRHYVLKYASARTVATIVTDLLGRGRPTVQVGRGGGMGQPAPVAQVAEDAVVATADDRTNTLVLVGPAEKLSLAEELIAKLDVETGAKPGSGEVQVFQLKNAKAEEISETLRQTFAGGAGAAVAPSGPGATRATVQQVRVVPDAATNRLVVSAPVDTMAQIRKLIDELDGAQEVIRSGARIVKLKNADAAQLAPVVLGAIQRRDGASRRGSTGAQLTVSADPRSNSLILSGAAGDMQAAAALVEQLDVELPEPGKPGARVVHVVQLKAGDATRLGPSLVRLFQQQAQARGPRGAAAQPADASTALRVEAEQATNSLIISAAPGDWPEVERILNELQKGVIDPLVPSTRLIKLQNAKAVEVAATLRQVYERRGGGGRSGQPAPVPVTISPSESANSLLISAGPAELSAIAELVATLDVPPAAGGVDAIRVFTLSTASADKVASTLRAMVAQSGRGQADVSIQGDSLSNTVLVRAPQAMTAMLEQTIAKLDKEIGPIIARETRTIALKSIAASQVVGALTQLYGQPRGGSRAGALPVGRAAAAQAEEPITIVAAPGDRAVVVDAPKNRLTEIEGLIKAWDVADSPMRTEVRTYVLTNAVAAEVATSLTRIYGAETRGASRTQQPATEAAPRFDANNTTNTLIVSATLAQLADIEKTIEELKAVSSEQNATKFFQLKNARAEDVAPVLESMLSDGASARGGRGATAAPAARVNQPAARVAAVPAANTLIVQGPPDKIALAATMIAQFDTAESGGLARQARTYQFVAGDVAELAKSLGRLFAEQQTARGAANTAAKEQAPRFEADPASRQIIVQASPAQFEQIEQIVKTLQDKGPVASVTQTFTIEHARLDDVAAMLTAMLPDMPGAARRGAPAADSAVRVSAVPPRGVVVQAPPDKLAIARQLIEQFDKPENKSVVQIVPLKSAEPVSLSQSVSQTLVARQPRGGAQGAQEGVTVTAEVNSNSVLVRGPADEVKAAVEMIRKLDDGGGEGTTVRLVALKNSDASELVKPLTAMFQDMVKQQAAARKGAGKAPTFSIAADTRTNSLMVSASPPLFALLEGLIAQLDKEQEVPQRVMEYVSLTNADAFDVSYKLESLYTSRRGAEKPVIEADSSSNTLTLIGKPADVEEMLAFVEKLDKTASSQVRVMPLSTARAEKMAQLIQRVYGQMTDADIVIVNRPAETQPAAPTGELLRGAPGAEGASSESSAPAGPASAPAGEEPATARPRISLIVDKQSNALVVSASRQDMERIQSLVDKLSAAPPSVESDFRVFEIKQADPFMVARVLEELFNPKPTTVAGAAGAARAARGGAAQQPAAPAAAPQVQVQAQPAAIVCVADARTRSLIVRAKNIDFDVIAPLITHLDQRSVNAGSIRVFALKNADATDLAANLRELFNLASQRGTQGRTSTAGAVSGTGPSGARADLIRQFIEMQGENGVTQVDVSSQIGITANRQANSVIVTAPPDVMDLVVKLVSELDQSSQASAPVVRLYPVRSAGVSSLVSELQEMFPRTTGAASTLSGTGLASRRGGSSAATGRDAPVVITGDEQARLILVSASSDMHPLIEKVIKDLDVARGGDETTVKVYRLLSADATAVASAVSAVLVGESAQAPSGRGSRGAAAASTVRISADRSSNSVVVRAGKEDHARIEALIAEMDAPQSLTVRTITLKNADAEAVAATLTKMFGGGSAARASAGRAGATAAAPASGGSVVITADKDSRTLLVRADDETFGAIQKLAEQLDTSAVGPVAREIIALKYAQAATLAPSLQAAFPQARGGAQRGSAATAAADDEVTIVAETTSNSIIVSGKAQSIEKVRLLVEKIDVDGGGQLRTEIAVLKNAKAKDIEAVLSKVVANMAPQGGAKGAAVSKVVVSGDAGSNALVFNGPAAEIEKLKKMAMDLDQVSTETGTQVYIVPLRTGDATVTAAMVKDLYNQQKSMSKTPQSMDPLAVSADQRANAIILATTKAMYEQVQQWVTTVEDMKPTRGPLRMITLQFADPAELQRAIDQMYGGGTTSGGAQSTSGGARTTVTGTRSPAAAPSTGGKTTVRPGPRGPEGAEAPAGAPGSTGAGSRVETSVLSAQRAVIVDASDEDFARIMELAKALDEEASRSKREIRIFTLKNANPTQIADAISRAYAAMRTNVPAPRPEDTVTAIPLPQTNAVVVTAGKEKLEEVKGLIEQLDKEEIAPPLDFRIYPLTNTSPAKILPMLRQLLAEIARGRPGETISVQGDDRTRTILVTARGAMFDRIEQIIKQLDQVPPYEKAEVLIVPLKHADATTLAAVLSDMLRPSGTAAVTPEAKALQEQVRLLRVRALDKDEIPELDLNQPIKIVPDPARQQGSNALMITSTPSNLKAMAAVINLLDVVPLAEGTVVRVKALQNADAQSVQTILRDMFTQGQQLAGKPGTTVEKKAQPESQAGKGLTSPLAVAADLRTNSIILSGVEETVALAEAIATDLDRNNGKLVTEVRAFKLKNADARTLAPILQAVFAEGSTTAAAAAGNAAIEGARTQASRLQTVMDGGAKSSSLAKLRPALSIQADPSTNILLVAARSDLMPLLADMIQTMDIPGPGSMNTVRFYPLNNADATRVQTVLNGLYTGAQAKFVRDEDKPNIAVDTRTNSLVVSASDKTFAVLENLLAKLDAKQPIDLRDIRLVPLKSADATALATTLQKMMDARVQRLSTLGAKDAEAMRVVVLADARSNALMVGGSAEGFELVKGLAEQLDNAGPALDGTVQIFPLVEGNAGTIAPTLQNLFNQRYAAARTPDVARQKPIVMADVRTNALLVAANADDTKVIEGLLKRLDVKLENPSVQLVVLPLTKNDAAVVANTVRTLFTQRLTSMTLPGQTPSPQDRVDIAADVLSNSMIVSASKENLDLIKGLLEKIDREPPPESGLIQIFQLKHAEPSRVASLLQSLVSQGLYKPAVVSAAGGQTAALSARERVAVVADERTGALIVSASKENMAVLEAIIKQVDTEVDLLKGDIRIFTLKKADAARLAPVLQQFFTQKRANETAVNTNVKILGVVVTADARTNTLMVTGGKEVFAAVEELLKRLDGDEIPVLTDYRIIPLKRATATVIAPTLQQLLANRISRPGVTKDPVTVLSDPRSNSLIIGASPEDIGAAEALVAQLDAEPDVGMAIRIFPLAKGDAKTVAANLQSIFTLNGKPSLTATVDERTNSIIVSAGETDMQRVADLIAKMDAQAENTQVTEIRVFTLRRADATEMATLLTSILTNKPKPMTTVSPNRQALLQFVSRTKEGQDLITSALQEGVLITPDRRSNSLVITAASDNMPLLSSLIEALDSTEPRAAQIKVFKLVNADARTLATVLSQLFKVSTGTGAAASAANARSIMYTLATSQPAGGSANVGSTEQDAMTITVDARTNCLLVGGTEQYVAMCEKVITELDASPAQERLTQVIRLRNARASDVQAALRTFLDQETQRIRSTLSADAVGAAQQMLDREVAVVSVGVEGNQANSTTLLLSASPRYFKVVDEMIKRLDQPAPQVLIQVLLAEVTLDNTTDLGFDWNYTTTHNENVIKGGTQFGIAEAIAKKAGGFSFSVTGGDLNLFFRALQSQGRLEILSRPQILAGDNQPGNINVGQRVPLITESRVTDQNTTISTITYEDVGIKLAVTPRINPDGYVKLLVAPEISSLSSSSVDISPGVKAPIINSRKASTTLTVQDGHTIIIGGLITTKDDSRESKVPLLGDIPLIGLLFKSTTVVKERTELLIVLTPHVIRTGEESDVLSGEQLRQLNLLRKTDPEQIHNDVLRPFGKMLNGDKKNGEPIKERIIPDAAPATQPSDN
jgi:type II secretion system protein D